MMRITYVKKPRLGAHRYIVAIERLLKGRCHGGSQRHTKYYYCLNRDSVRELRNKAPRGCVVTVFSATHTFREAWQK